jgi:PAS domain S-box-containing protein
MTGSVVDVSARKLAERTAAQSAERFRLFTELASDYVYQGGFDEGGQLIPEIVAGSFERTTGFTAEEVAARGGWVECIHPDDRIRALGLVDTLMRGETLVHEYRIVDRAGQIRWLRDRIVPFVDPQKGHTIQFMGCVSDVTEQHELADRLVHAHKMESLARLAGGVAHDLNNLLTVLLGEIEFLRGTDERATVPERDESYASLDEVIRRASELTRSLLAFGRRSVGERRVMFLQDAIDTARPMLMRGAGERVRLVLDAAQAVGAKVAIDQGELHLVLLNLVLNARDAMPKGGRLVVRADRVAHDAAASTRPRELTPGEYGRIIVHDEGIGMRDDVRQRVFEPYFTTKAIGKGTGLGLATAYGIIRRIGGTITVESREGAGSTFSVLLPMTDAPIDTVVAPLTTATLGGTAFVLVVEDEPALRRVVTRTLQRLGYQVLEASNAEEALELADGATRPIDLLITDVRLPGQDGLTLARELAHRRPALRILITSGYLEDGALESLEAADYPFLAKPFGADALASACAELLRA